jgi:hypothetical protein
MQVARKSLLVINWTVFGILALLSFSSGADGGIQIGLLTLIVQQMQHLLEIG